MDTKEVEYWRKLLSKIVKRKVSIEETIEFLSGLERFLDRGKNENN